MSHHFGDLFEVAVDAPLFGPLTYAVVPDGPMAERGISVRVPLGSRTVNAVVLGVGTAQGDFKLKAIKEIHPERPKLPEPTIQWLEWLADYYKHPIGQVTAMAFPPLKKATKETGRKSAAVPSVEYAPPPTLSLEQKQCVEAIQQYKGFSTHLLFGVTGSGKTEVYLHLLKDVVERGEQGLVLVPEISLTPQLIQRFSARFPGKVAVIHSHLTPREKTNQWWSMVDGEKSILVGARSALFCPIKKVGIIIVDEEHEPSFKQEEKLKYHARDAAVMLAKFHQCPVVLGSATPSLESWTNAQEGKYHLHQMKARVSDREMPEVHVIDMRETREERKQNNDETLPFWLSPLLFEKMRENLENKEQTALFLNRRGMAQVVLCSNCGHIEECPNCAISLTLHVKNHLVCHYCDFTKPMRDTCSQCPDGDIKPLGLGTELVETEVKKLFPFARVARADRDEINSRQDLESLIENMEKREIDILIGTQMIAKGLDFEGLTLVGLILADVGFNLPDFRSAERSFQLITQMSGRSGRHSQKRGQVVIQAYNPEHHSIQFARENDFLGFAKHETSIRKEMGYPPFGRLCAYRIQGLQFEKAQQAGLRLAHRARALQNREPKYEQVQVLGPAPAPLAKLRGKYRFHVLLKFPNAGTMISFNKQIMADLSWVPSQTKVQIDVDPISML